MHTCIQTTAADRPGHTDVFPCIRCSGDYRYAPGLSADQKEITVKLNNNGTLPALVQSWIDTGSVESTPTSSKAPFLLSPPVARIDPTKGQSLRVLFTGAPLAQDKESVFWLNVLEIPPKPEAGADLNTLQMAFRSRIKLFYRPVGLPGNPNEAVEQVQWQLVTARDGQGLALKGVQPVGVPRLADRVGPGGG